MGGLDVLTIYRARSDDLSSWESVDAKMQGQTAVITTREGGVYVARSQPNAGAIAGIVIACLVVVALVVVGVVMYMRMNPEKKSKLLRPFQSKV